MMDALYAAATGMTAQQTSMDVIANNLANVNTAGFKATRLAFQDLLYQQVGSRQAARDGAQVGMGVSTARTTHSLAQGTLTESSELTNMAIEGDGYFPVQNGASIGYTRDGSFTLDANGQLVNGSGNRLVPGIALPAGADPQTLSIGPEGKVTAKLRGNTIIIGQIQTANFSNPNGLEAVGNNLLVPTANSGAAQAGLPGSGGRGFIRQGFTEGSNVSIMDEMVNMISAQRAFESVSKVLSASDEMLGMANSMRR